MSIATTGEAVFRPGGQPAPARARPDPEMTIAGPAPAVPTPQRRAAGGGTGQGDSSVAISRPGPTVSKAAPPSSQPPPADAGVRASREAVGAQPVAAPQVAGAAGVPLREGDVIERYRLVRRLGGRVGAVFLAENVGTRERVALKILKDDGLGKSPSWERFQYEAAIAAVLAHPNIVRANRFGSAKGFCFVEMEFVPGEALSEYTNRTQGAAPCEEALSLMRQVASALGALADKGVVHRDLRPENVLLALDGQARIADIGFHHVIQQSGAGAASSAGAETLAYMAPEQWHGKPLDTRADQYCLGAMIFELLTGRPPVEGDNYLIVARNLVARGPAPVGQFRPDLPPWIQEIIDRTLRVESAQRFPSMMALIAAIDAGLGAAPPPAGVATIVEPVPEAPVEPACPAPVEPPAAGSRVLVCLLMAVAVLVIVGAIVLVSVPGLMATLTGWLSGLLGLGAAGFG